MEVCEDVVEVCEDVEMCEDVVDEVQDGSVAWPCCLWYWCSLTRLVVLDHAGVDVTMLALATLDYAGAESVESVESVSGRKEGKGRKRMKPTTMTMPLMSILLDHSSAWPCWWRSTKLVLMVWEC